MGDFSSAVDAAKKSNSPKTWKELTLRCVQAMEFGCAHTAGLQILMYPDHIEEVILAYERDGHLDELVKLLEEGVTKEGAHGGLITELAILYAKYHPSKLKDFLNSSIVNSSRINIPKLIRTCETYDLWSEVIHLYIVYNEYDAACTAVINHSAVAWDHSQFLTIVEKITNSENYYRSITFYLEEHPLLVNSILDIMMPKLDNKKIIAIFRVHGYLPLLLPYLLQVQHLNSSHVNEAINEIFLESEDIEGLRESINNYDNFDSATLEKNLESHDLLEMRRLATLLFKKNKRFKKAIEISMNDKHYKDAVETARASGSKEHVEELLKLFAANGDKVCFASCLYICYDLVDADVALELAWKNGLIDQLMPFMIQVVRESNRRYEMLERRIGNREQAAEKEKSAPNDYVPMYHMQGDMRGAPYLPGMNNLALMGPQAGVDLAWKS